MVHQWHFVGGYGGAGVSLDGGGAVWGAGEVGRGGVVEVVLKDEGEFVHEVGILGGYGGGVEGGDEDH